MRRLFISKMGPPNMSLVIHTSSETEELL
jgi:hypothetical protein